MRKFCLFLVLAIIVGGIFWLAFFSQETAQTNQLASMLEELNTKEKSIRQPAVAGQFYPDSQEELTEMISQFLEKADLPKKGESDPQIRALIVPHAGYVFSGEVAAYGFKAIQGLIYLKLIHCLISQSIL